MQITHFIDEFSGYLLTQQRSSHHTVSGYASDMVQLMSWLETRNVSTIEQCSIDLLRDYLQHLVQEEQHKAVTIRRKIATIKAFFGFASLRYKVPNIATELIFPKAPGLLPKALNPQQLQQLLDSVEADTRPIGVRNKLLLYMLYATGMRVSELIALTVSAIDLESGFVRVWGKGNKERAIPLVKPMLVLLQHYVQDIRPQLLNDQAITDMLFFTVQHGKANPMTRQAIWAIIKTIGKPLLDAGVKLSPHVLRHTIATHLLQQGADLRSLQLLLGHEQLSTVQIYTQLQTSYLRQVYDSKHSRS